MNNKPIYLIITTIFPSKQSFRGSYIYDQIKAIIKDGRYNVVVIMPEVWYHKANDYIYDGIYVHRFKYYDLPTNAWPGLFDRLNVYSFNKTLKRINISYNNIAVVHAHITKNAIYANFIKQKNPKVKTILQHHGYDVLGLSDGRFANKKWHKKHCITYGINICNKIDLHIGVSNETLHYLESYNGIHIKNKYVLYNGVDTEKFHKLHNRVNKANVFHIGCIANFWKLKDQITLIKAVEILINEGNVNINVSFIGTGYTRRMCETYVLEHNLSKHFDFLSEVDHRQLNNYYNTLDLFVLPSYWDAFGCVYTEAFACGIPFMTAKGSGITELICDKDFDKWVIEPHNYVQLAHNIKRYMNTHDEQKLKYPIDINILISSFLNYLTHDV